MGAMAFMRALVELNRDSLVPADKSVNIWHFVTPGTVAAAAPTVTTLLDTFYTDIETRMSQTLTGTGAIKYYDLEDAEPRAPVATGAIAFTPGVSAYPGEVAICLSFQGPVVSGFNQARRRGRLYIGPLASSTGAVDVADVRPGSATRTDICDAAEALMTDTTLPGLIWSVFSPSTAGPPPYSGAALVDAFVTVTNGWVNDAFDTMRSRGAAPTARTVFP